MSTDRKKQLRRLELHWADVPASHVRGREYRNSDSGNPRPWLIVSVQGTQLFGMVVAVPLTTSLGRLDDPGVENFRLLIPRDAVTRAPSDSGELLDRVALCDQLRSLSVDRFRATSRLGKLKNDWAPYIEEKIRNVLGMDDE